MEDLEDLEGALEFEVSDLCQWLEGEGFERDDSSGFPVYEADGVRVLMPREQRPWVTVQKMRFGHVVWYNDFSMDIPNRAIFRFIKEV